MQDRRIELQASRLLHLGAFSFSVSWAMVDCSVRKFHSSIAMLLQKETMNEKRCAVAHETPLWKRLLNRIWASRLEIRTVRRTAVFSQLDCCVVVFNSKHDMLYMMFYTNDHES